MKFTCLSGKLKQKLALADKVTGKNLTLPVLGTILLSVSKNTLRISATNLEVGVETTLIVKGLKDGVIAVSGGVLDQFLNTVSDNETVSFEKTEGGLSLVAQKHTALVRTHPTDDFPKIPKIKDGEKLLIEKETIIKGLQSVLFAVSTSDIKPEIASVYVYTENGKITFVATDSFRLAEKKIPFKKDVSIESILIPYRNAAEIIRFFEGGQDEEITVFLDKNQLSLQSQSTYLTTRLTSGTYPNYQQIIPQTQKTKGIILKNDFTQALKFANIFSDEFNRVLLRLFPNDSRMEVESKNGTVGEGVTKVDAELSGEDIEMGFNYKYLSEVFSVLSADSVSISFNGSNKPVVVSGVGDKTFLYLVMPVNR